MNFPLFIAYRYLKARRSRHIINRISRISIAGITLGTMALIIILSVLLGIAIPSFSSWLPKYRLRGAARDIYSNLQLAKMTAVKDRARCGVFFNVAGNSYQVISSGPNLTFGDIDDSTPRTVNLSEYGSGVGYGHGSATQTATTTPDTSWDNNVTFPGDGVVFDSRGMVLSPSGAASTGGYVYLQNSKNGTHAMGVWSSGVTVMARWTGSAWQ